ncbi:NUP62, partial [Symbiodinium sp. KB8]
RWSSQLEEHKSTFVSQAEQIAGWDADMRSHHKALLSLASEVHELQDEESKQDQRLEAVSSHLDDIDQSLDILRQNVSDLMRQSGNREGALSMRSADSARTHYYQLAGEVSSQLHDAEQQLEVLTSQMAQLGQAQSQGATEAIRRTVEAHMRTMQWIDDTVGVLNAEADAVGLQLQQFGVGGSRSQ